MKHYWKDKIIIAAALTITMLLAGLSVSADTTITVRYTSDPADSESLIQYDEAAESPSFEKGSPLFLEISFIERESGGSTETDEPEPTESATAPIVTMQNSSDDTLSPQVLTETDGYYTVDTSQIGSYRILVDQNAIMTLTITEPSGDEEEHPIQPAEVTPTRTGIFQKNGAYYYASSDGTVRKKTGFVTWNGNRYYIQSGGKIAAGKTFKVGKHTYRAFKDGRIATGAYKWGKYYRFSSPTGIVRTAKGFVSANGKRYYVLQGGKLRTNSTFRIGTKKYHAYKDGHLAKGVFKMGSYYYYASSKYAIKYSKGFVTWKGNRYYVRKGGHIMTGKTFKIGKYTYRAFKDGRIAIGVYKWGTAYYYANKDGHLRKSAGMVSWKGHKYYVRSGGKLYKNRFFFHNANMYYAGSNGAVKTGTFKVGNYTYVATSGGVITSSDRKYMRGIDVSYFQGRNINWTKVKNNGISFAFLRAGYSGMEKGTHNEDSTFKLNIKGATAAGIDVGVYYFTQARTAKEAKSEADYTIKLIKESGCPVTLPVVIDTENLAGSRTAIGKLSRAKRTEVIKAFCDEIKAKGYTPMIYASTSWLNNQLDMSKLSGYKVWVAQYYTEVTYSRSYQCWQYTSSGSVDGISGRVDLNYWTL